METVLFALAVFLLAIAGLALGPLLGRAPVKGSCGGLDCVAGADCAACPRRERKP